MSYKIIKNSEPTSKEIKYSGECGKCEKEAEVTIYAIGFLQAKTDIQKTYRRSGASCSLLKNNEPFCELCPLITDEEFK